MAGDIEKADKTQAGFKDGVYLSPRQMLTIILAVVATASGAPVGLDYFSGKIRVDDNVSGRLTDIKDRISRIESRCTENHAEINGRLNVHEADIKYLYKATK